MRFLFVINPSSGRTNNDDAETAIQDLMQKSAHEHRIFHTTGENDSQLIRAEFKEYHPDSVVACGGDGTIQLVARSLVGTNTRLGIVPLGSANGLAKALNIPDNTDAALEVLISQSNTIDLDLIRVNDHICIHLSDIGTNALLVKNYEESGDKGMIGYAKHLMSSIRESEQMHYTIRADNQVVEASGYMLMIANANQYGTGVKISDGSVSDGKFEICNVKEITLPEAVKASLTALNIFVDKDMFSDVISCAQADIKIDRAVHLQIDGEYIGEVDQIRAEIIPAAFKLVVP